MQNGYAGLNNRINVNDTTLSMQCGGQQSCDADVTVIAGGSVNFDCQYFESCEDVALFCVASDGTVYSESVYCDATRKWRRSCANTWCCNHYQVEGSCVETAGPTVSPTIYDGNMSAVYPTYKPTRNSNADSDADEDDADGLAGIGGGAGSVLGCIICVCCIYLMIKGYSGDSDGYVSGSSTTKTTCADSSGKRVHVQVYELPDGDARKNVSERYWMNTA
mmetsp:Transcript_6731/g.11050  ORF Transcript_6731/g.11050 Transcript_6731/m.11050 type:complete len:220 (+) Transcript_6731:3-662(+)